MARTETSPHPVCAVWRPLKAVAIESQDGASARLLSSWSIPQHPRRREGTHQVRAGVAFALGSPPVTPDARLGRWIARAGSRRLVEPWRFLWRHNEAGRLRFFSDHAGLAERVAYDAYIAPLHRQRRGASCCELRDVASLVWPACPASWRL